MPAKQRPGALLRTTVAAILVMAATAVVGEEYLSRDAFLDLVFSRQQPDQQQQQPGQQRKRRTCLRVP